MSPKAALSGDPTRTPSQRPEWLEVRVQRTPYGPHRAVYEIWTQRSIYTLDASLCCASVIDRESGQSRPNHLCVGAMLVGGHLTREDKRSEISYPLPALGSRAIFRRKGCSTPTMTSDVTRVVLHLQNVVSAER